MSPPLPPAFPPPAGGRADLLIIAGEHSGDEQAARMLRGLLARRPELQVAALGGPALQAAGAQLLYDLTASSVVGLVEVLRNFRFFRGLHARDPPLDRRAPAAGRVLRGLPGPQPAPGGGDARAAA